MNIKAILFDLDGTLLPMDQEKFTGGYFKLLAKKAAPLGYAAEPLIDAIWAGTAAMVKNDGSRSNEAAFWDRFSGILGAEVLAHRDMFEEFYREDFDAAKRFCGFDPRAAEAVRLAKQMGCRVALATNPIFPAVATEHRIRWAGLAPEEFEFYTSYETIGFCKPNPVYYLEIARRMELRCEECLMVGNDATEDMIAKEIGMQVFLLTDCLLNKAQKDVSAYPGGSFAELLDFLRALRK